MTTEGILRPRMLAAGALAAFAFLLLDCTSRPARETEYVYREQALPRIGNAG